MDLVCWYRHASRWNLFDQLLTQYVLDMSAPPLSLVHLCVFFVSACDSCFSCDRRLFCDFPPFQRDWSLLKACDQLLTQQRLLNAFGDFVEAPVTFAPTYKFKTGPGSDPNNNTFCLQTRGVTNDVTSHSKERQHMRP